MKNYFKDFIELNNLSPHLTKLVGNVDKCLE